MSYKTLYIFVEGNDDEDFFKAIKEKVFKDKYGDIQIVQYAQREKRYLKNYLDSIRSMGADYIFLADLDRFPCVTAKKDKLQEEYPFIERHRIIVVVKEIESWYLAGVDQEKRKKIGIKGSSKITNDLTKEQFQKLKPKNFVSLSAFREKLLGCFSLQTARENDTSFDYFLRKFN